MSFPEYGPRSYKAAGRRLVVSCPLLHAVSGVTKGRRFAFLPFLYDDEASRIRAETTPVRVTMRRVSRLMQHQTGGVSFVNHAVQPRSTPHLTLGSSLRIGVFRTFNSPTGGASGPPKS